MTNIPYTNIPPQQLTGLTNQTVQIFNNYYQFPININNNELVAMTGFFENRGFQSDSAESISIAILTQAAQEGFNGLQVMDSLNTLGETQLSGIVAQILNYNRLNTSLLGTVQSLTPPLLISQNIIP